MFNNSNETICKVALSEILSKPEYQEFIHNHVNSDNFAKECLDTPPEGMSALYGAIDKALRKLVYIGQTSLPPATGRFPSHYIPYNNATGKPKEYKTKFDLLYAMDPDRYYIKLIGYYSNAKDPCRANRSQIDVMEEFYIRDNDLVRNGLNTAYGKGVMTEDELAKQASKNPAGDWRLFSGPNKGKVPEYKDSVIDFDDVPAYSNKDNKMQICAIDTKTNDIVKYFNSRNEAVKFLQNQGVSAGPKSISIEISRALRNARNRSTAYGYKWGYR